MTLTKLLISLICIFLSYGYIQQFFRYLVKFNFGNSYIGYFSKGFVVFFVLGLFILKRLSFFTTFMHELVHLIFDILFLHKPKRFFASEYEGGYVTSSGNNFLIYLAPYFFPTLVIVLMPFINIMKSTYHPYFFMAIGVFTSFHILTSFKWFIEAFGSKFSDISIVGKVFSVIFLIFANILIYGFILAFVNGGFSEGLYFLRSGFEKNIIFLNRFTNIGK